jgi:hypothetical protein
MYPVFSSTVNTEPAPLLLSTEITPAHQLHQPLGDGKAQARTPELGIVVPGLLGEGREEHLLEFPLMPTPLSATGSRDQPAVGQRRSGPYSG